jgi:alpha-tubulin suppressor-like RCC1 family protein
MERAMKRHGGAVTCILAGSAVPLLMVGILGSGYAAASSLSALQTPPAHRAVVSTSTDRWGAFYTPTNSDPNEADAPSSVGNLTGITAIAAGNASDMALDSQGDVWTWGDGVNGVLGDGDTSDHVSSAVEVSGLPKIVAIGEADDTDVAVDASGDVWGWGWNEGGQLCTGDTTNEKTPVELSNLSHVIAAAGGGTHMTYLLANGTVEACGQNNDGQLGDGTTTDNLKPVKVKGLPSSPVTAITAGPSSSTALLKNGQVWDWGQNNYGQLGDNQRTISDVPVHVVLPAPAAEVYAGGDNQKNGQSLALLTNGQVWGWGNNQAGQLGNGTTKSVNKLPVEATSLPSGVTFTYVATGGDHSLALDSAGDVYAWGSDSHGQLGDAGNADEGTPGAAVLVPVKVLSGADLVSATANDSVAALN